jgi:hypothetical protein
MGFMDIFKASQYKKEAEQLKQQLDSLCFNDYDSAQKEIKRLNEQAETLNRQIEAKQTEINALNAEKEKSDKQLRTSINKLSRSKEIYKSVEYSIDNFFNLSPALSELKLNSDQVTDIEDLSPSVILKLHYMDIKSLRKAYRDNDKQIEKVLSQYRKRYTTKANKAIYELMVIALRAELQNILFNLKYDKLDNAIDQVKKTTKKYLDIAATGNQSIAGTLTKFIGEIEYLFLNAVKIEYNYYVKKEQARQEQLAIREQMKQEAEERKALEQEKKKIEREESKYNAEIDKLKSQMENASNAELEALNKRILELQNQLSDVILQKDKIVNLQNGKAGNVYIISNLGSFGDNMFKIGMTRRLEPQERVNELGNASVPFKFDVHSFIFSEDAVGLESKLHSLLNDKRVNKVNLRKEFFQISIDELEKLINEIDPTAEFNKTMVAEEFRQSQSTNENYTSDIEIYDEEDD